MEGGICFLSRSPSCFIFLLLLLLHVPTVDSSSSGPSQQMIRTGRRGGRREGACEHGRGMEGRAAEETVCPCSQTAGGVQSST